MISFAEVSSLSVGGVDVVRLFVFAEEVILGVLFAVAGVRAFVRRRRSSDALVRRLFKGVIYLSIGIILKALWVSTILFIFWDRELTWRLLLIEGSIVFLIYGGHNLVRHDFRELGDFLAGFGLGGIDEEYVETAKERTERLLEESRASRRD